MFQDIRRHLCFHPSYNIVFLVKEPAGLNKHSSKQSQLKLLGSVD